MLKHVEQSVALAAIRWFRQHEAGLAAMYAPHTELDAQFRGRLKLLRDNAAELESSIAHDDPAAWAPETVLAAFQATLMLKDAMDAAGPVLLKRTHVLIERQAGLHGKLVETVAEARARAAKAAPKRRRTDHQRDFSPKRRTARDAVRNLKAKAKARAVKKAAAQKRGH